MTTYTDDYTGETCKGITVRGLIALLEQQDPDAEMFLAHNEPCETVCLPMSNLVVAGDLGVYVADVDYLLAEAIEVPETKPLVDPVPDLDMDDLFGC